MSEGCDDAELYRGMPKDLLQDVKRAAYEAKVREMEDQQRAEERRAREGTDA